MKDIAALRKGYNIDLASSYQPANRDESSDPKYYGFLAWDGAWYIMRDNSSTGVTDYCRGTSGYDAAWTAKDEQSYVAFSSLFA